MKPGPPSNHSIRAAKLVKCKDLVVRRGFSVPEAAERVGLSVGGTKALASQEGWIAERADWRQLAAPIELDLDRECHNRQALALVRLGLGRLERDNEIAVDKFASALDTLDKVARRILGLGAESQAGGTLTVLARNAVVTNCQAA